MQETQTNQNFNVMQVVSNLDIGGGQEVVRTLAVNLNEMGARTIVCAFEDGPLQEEIEQEGIPVFILPGRSASILSLPRFIQEMRSNSEALQELIDVLNQQRNNANLIIATGRRLDSAQRHNLVPRRLHVPVNQ